MLTGQPVSGGQKSYHQASFLNKIKNIGKYKPYVIHHFFLRASVV
jgi:hypothetical protein